MTKSPHAIPTVAVIAFEENNVLLVKHREAAAHITGIYGLPSGRVEKDESLLEVAMREFREETGLTGNEKDFTQFPNNLYEGNIKRKGDRSELMQMSVFVCQQYAGELANSEETIPEWVGIHELEKYTLLPNVYTAIMDALQYELKN